MQIPESIIRFLERQNFILISSLDHHDAIHCSAKGLAAVEATGLIWIVDLYQKQTFKNVKRDPRVSITAVDEHTFIGYTLQGKAQIVERKEIPEHLFEIWEERIIRRVSQRVVRGVQTRAKSKHQYEAKLPPEPQYVMAIQVDNIIDLAPPFLRKGGSKS